MAYLLQVPEKQLDENKVKQVRCSTPPQMQQWHSGTKATGRPFNAVL
jgi:hypothetical protein